MTWAQEKKAELERLKRTYREITAQEGPPPDSAGQPDNLPPAWQKWREETMAVRDEIYERAREAGITAGDFTEVWRELEDHEASLDGNRRQSKLR